MQSPTGPVLHPQYGISGAAMQIKVQKWSTGHWLGPLKGSQTPVKMINFRKLKLRMKSYYRNSLTLFHQNATKISRKYRMEQRQWRRHWEKGNRKLLTHKQTTAPEGSLGTQCNWGICPVLSFLPVKAVLHQKQAPHGCWGDILSSHAIPPGPSTKAVHLVSFRPEGSCTTGMSTPCGEGGFLFPPLKDVLFGEGKERPSVRERRGNHITSWDEHFLLVWLSPLPSGRPGRPLWVWGGCGRNIGSF